MATPTFGSAGDIIQVALLVKSLVNALSESNGSLSEYQTTVRELNNLDGVIYELQGLVDLCRSAGGYDTLIGIVEVEVSKCKALMLPFLLQLDKYKQSLRVGGSGKPVRDAYKKMHWKLSRQDCLDEFRRAINIQRECMLALLHIHKYKADMIADKRLEHQLVKAFELREHASQSQMALLSGHTSKLKDIMERVKQLEQKAAARTAPCVLPAQVFSIVPTKFELL
ncbi:hypothetical protein EJ08DRAFT_267525 [Tothia fuscella]|uniref:Fungal N-terminal domain-containing protein n=1 Tax=Tothia fuscella TaxID=1048955 RepID=A0A9P4NR64_9PEZI|nr:hypothetical protein EJ08DRAFT_267525 [Tothia fuscella]